MENILFLDIETVPQQENYHSLDSRWKKLWDKKAKQIAQNEESPEALYPRAGIYAEFGKIICISVGFMILKKDDRMFRMTSFYGEDEKEILTKFCELLQKITTPKIIFYVHIMGKSLIFLI